MQPSFGGKRKWFLLARETNKGGGAVMSADTCPGLSTGPLLPGDSVWVLGSPAGRSALWVPGFRWGWCGEEGGKKRGRERKREMGVGFLKRPRNNGFCESRHSKRCVQGHERICAKRNVFYGKLTPVKLNICSKETLVVKAGIISSASPSPSTRTRV